MIAVIQLRGIIDARQDVKDTLRMLNLTRNMSCVLVEDTPTVRGMLQKVKDNTTYGTVSDETVKALQKIMVGKTAHLHPPRGGMKSIKRPFKSRGDLGDRGDAMNDLIARMLP